MSPAVRGFSITHMADLYASFPVPIANETGLESYRYATPLDTLSKPSAAVLYVLTRPLLIVPQPFVIALAERLTLVKTRLGGVFESLKMLEEVFSDFYFVFYVVG